MRGENNNYNEIDLILKLLKEGKNPSEELKNIKLFGLKSGPWT